MTKKRKLIAVLLPLVLMLGWLLLGIYRDREFGDHHLFVKHQPSVKFRFYAPLGESDFTLNDLDPERSQEEVMYREYVEAHGGNKRSIPLGW